MTAKRTTTSFEASIFKKAVLLSLNLHTLGNTRKIPKSWIREKLLAEKPMANPDEIDEQVKRLGNSKRLLDSPELEAVNEEQRKLYCWCRDHSMPSFFQSAFYLVCKDETERFDSRILETEARLRDTLIPALVAAYPQRKTEAEAVLGPLGLFSEADFPPVEDIPARVYVEYNWLGINVPTGLSPELRAAAEQRLEQKFQRVEAEVENALREMYAKVVDYGVALLAPKKDEKGEKTIRSDSAAALVARFSDFHETFKSRNLTDDAELEKLVEQAKKAMKGVTADDVQTNESLQERLGVILGGIKGEMDKLVVPKAKRKLNLE